MSNRKPKIMQTKLKKFIYDNDIMSMDIASFTKKIDLDKMGLSAHHIYEIQNGHTIPNINTLVLICEALSVMLDRTITPNDLINYRTLPQVKDQMARNTE